MERKIERVKKRREINLDQESPANNFERSARLEFLLERYQFGLQNTLRISREPLVVVIRNSIPEKKVRARAFGHHQHGRVSFLPGLAFDLYFAGFSSGRTMGTAKLGRIG